MNKSYALTIYSSGKKTIFQFHLFSVFVPGIQCSIQQNAESNKGKTFDLLWFHNYNWNHISCFVSIKNN